MARLARRALADARGRRPAAPVRRLARRRDRRDRPVRDGRLVARARGVQADVRGADLPRARHDSSAGDSCARGAARPEADAVRVGVEVRLDARDALAYGLLLGAEPPRRELGGDHRSRFRSRGAGAEAKLPRRLPGRADDRRPLLGALAVRARARVVDGRRPDASARSRDRDGGRVPARRGQSRAWSSGWRSARAGATAATRSASRRARATSASGSSSCSPSRPASSARG